MKTQKLTKNILFAATLVGLVVPIAFLSSCGEPVDRNAVVNPKIEGKLVTLANVSDATKSSLVVYSRSENLDTVSAKSSGLVTALGGKTEKSNIDTNKVLSAVSSEDKKAFLDSHLSSGGVVAFVSINDTIRVLAVVSKDEVSKVATNDVKDLTLEDVKDAKTNRIAKADRIMRIRRSEPTNNVRLLEVAAIEVEKSGALESEKTDYNETKPTLNIITKLPLEVSTHAILKGEAIDTSNKAKFATTATPAADGKAGDKK